MTSQEVEDYKELMQSIINILKEVEGYVVMNPWAANHALSLLRRQIQEGMPK